MFLETTQNVRPSEIELAAWNAHFRGAPPQALLRWAAGRWSRSMALTSSFGGPVGMVLIDMVLSVVPDLPVLYIDTGLLFPETYQLVAQVRERYGITPQPVRAARSLAQQAQSEGEALWERDPDTCCRLRKVQPLGEALAPFGAWVTGVRRDGSDSRAQVRLVEWSEKYQLVKLNPLAFWTEREVWGYISRHSLPYNPLLDQGYRSLGCVTCTRLPDTDHARSGRWSGFNKTECGLHVEK